MEDKFKEVFEIELYDGHKLPSTHFFEKAVPKSFEVRLTEQEFYDRCAGLMSLTEMNKAWKDYSSPKMPEIVQKAVIEITDDGHHIEIKVLPSPFTSSREPTTHKYRYDPYIFEHKDTLIREKLKEIIYD